MLDSLITILLFLFVFCLIVISHEFGHFIVAKMNGVRVIEFGIGMGPKVVGFHKNGTYYCIRLLPIGGACIYDMGDIEDDDDSDKKTGISNHLVKQAGLVNPESHDDSANMSEKTYNGAEARLERINNEKLRSRGKYESKEGSDDGFLNEKQGIPFTDAPVLVKIAIVAAGPIFNFILAYLLALIVVWNTGSTSPEIIGVMDGYPAQEAGMQSGDIITSMNGSTVYLANEIYVNTYLNREREMTIEYLRDGKKYTVTVTPKYSEEHGRYLVGFDGYGKYVSCKNASVFKYSYYEVRYGFVGVIKSLEMLIQGRGSKDDVAGPVGMAQTIDNIKNEAAPYGVWVVFINMLNIAMLLSVNLGIINLLPLPAIDGGRLIFLIVELVRGKPIPPEKEGIVHLVGFALLMVLMVFVMYNDIMRIVTG